MKITITILRSHAGGARCAADGAGSGGAADETTTGDLRSQWGWASLVRRIHLVLLQDPTKVRPCTIMGVCRGSVTCSTPSQMNDLYF